MKPEQLRCDFCGQFMNYLDLLSGAAERACTEPQSEFSDEKWVNNCKKCLEQSGAEA